MSVLDAVFFLALSAFLAHELDAMHKREWRLLYGLRGLPDDRARQTFMLLHVPVVALLLAGITHPAEAVQARTMAGVDVFLVVHAAVHRWMQGHPEYWFKSGRSRALIYAPALLGLLHLAGLAAER